MCLCLLALVGLRLPYHEENLVLGRVVLFEHLRQHINKLSRQRGFDHILSFPIQYLLT